MNDNKNSELLIWSQALESRRTLLINAMIVVCVAMILITAFRNPVDYDGYWHLRMGMDWVENGLSPWLDHYSFTFYNHPISTVPYQFQVLLYGAIHLFGEHGGMIAIKLVLFLFIFSCLVVWLRQIKAPTIGFLIGLAIGIIGIQLRAQVRPELLSYGFMLIALILYQRTQLKLTIKAFAPILVLLVVWTNYHSPVFGYIVFFGLFIDIAIRLLKEKCPTSEWIKLAAWGLMVYAAGCLRPGFYPPVTVFGAERFLGVWQTHIQEYLPPTYYIGTEMGYFLVTLAVITLLALAVRRMFGLLFVAAVFVYYAHSMGRIVAPAVIICAALLPYATKDWLSMPLIKGSSHWLRTCATIAITAFLVFTLVFGVRISRSYMHENLTSWAAFPSRLLTYFENTGRAGNIFNSYEMGGYLIYKLSPESKVYIDGRTNILYPHDHYIQYLTAIADPEVFQEEAQKYDIAHAVLQSTAETASMMREAGWTLEFEDVRYALFQPSDGRLEQYGRLWGQPYCWSDETESALPRELSHLVNEQASEMLQRPLMHYSLAYVSSSNRKKFLEETGPTYDYDDSGKRFLAGRALENQAYDTAVELSASIEVREPRDDLVSVVAYGLVGNWESAQIAMVSAKNISWRFVLQQEAQLQLKILNWVDQHSALQPQLASWKDELTRNLGASIPMAAIGADTFCFDGVSN